MWTEASTPSSFRFPLPHHQVLPISLTPTQASDPGEEEEQAPMQSPQRKTTPVALPKTKPASETPQIERLLSGLDPDDFMWTQSQVSEPSSSQAANARPEAEPDRVREEQPQVQDTTHQTEKAEGLRANLALLDDLKLRQATRLAVRRTPSFISVSPHSFYCRALLDVPHASSNVILGELTS